MNTKDYLKRLIDLLTEDNVITIRFVGNNTHIPSILKKENKYMIYINMYSQYESYNDINDLIDEYFDIISHNKDDFYFSLNSKERFYEMRKLSIIKEMEELSNKKESETTFNLIKEQLEQYGGTYVISASKEIKFLISACISDEDYYFIYLVSTNKNGIIGIELSFDSCVGDFIPLIDKLNENEYKRVQNHIINEAIETLDPKTLRPGYEILQEKLKNEFNNSTEYVLFTPIYLIK